jgi:acyl-CoA synthetase (AMP-forming)/AMP-acid ligase II
MLAEHPSVVRAAVVGVPDPVLGEVGVAYVVADPDGPRPDHASLRAWCLERIADYKAPDRVVVLDELPITPMLKVDKRALVERAAAETMITTTIGREAS